ncbi:MAG: hypothetical protein COT55_02355 [Candidatus Diapherotrites archaeon CG09_land_8_20_14_0_10_32_12]|nr:MAG: hypothetical protein COT55_02355 [Candidatus Diapherotrites archaeon CG09_land_8_20_14_0_10_32_12]
MDCSFIKRIIYEIPYYKQYFESTDPEFLQSKYTDSELEDLEKLLKIKFKMPAKEPKAMDKKDGKIDVKPKDKLNQYLEKSETTLAPTKTPTNAGRGKQVTLF